MFMVYVYYVAVSEKSLHTAPGKYKIWGKLRSMFFFLVKLVQYHKMISNYSESLAMFHIKRGKMEIYR